MRKVFDLRADVDAVERLETVLDRSWIAAYSLLLQGAPTISELCHSVAALSVDRSVTAASVRATMDSLAAYRPLLQAVRVAIGKSIPESGDNGEAGGDAPENPPHPT